jgi:recombinational DNA repair protein RecT
MSTVNKVSEQLAVAQPAQIAELDFVRDRYIKNYNACNKGKIGDLMYHKNVVHFKQQIMASQQLAAADKFSLYAVFVTAAVNGYSLDPADQEVYIIARGGKAYLERQAGSYVRRLIRTGQIQMCEQAKLVYEGDDFLVQDGRVVKHVENFKTDNIVAGYVKVLLDENGKSIYFIYRKSDWESWRKKSPNPKTYEKIGQKGNYLSESLWDNGIVGGTNPEPNFLRTKLIKHTCKEKCWSVGNTQAVVETYSEFEIEANEDGEATLTENVVTAVTPTLPISDNSFVEEAKQEAESVTVEDDTF